MTLLAAACASTAPPPVPPPVAGEDRYLVDPRTGFTHAVPPAIEKRFDTAWRFFLAGDFATARRQLTEIRTRNPEYLPAALAEAAVDLKEGNLEAAHAIVQRVEDQAPESTVARAYDAEIAVAGHRNRAAYDIYRSLAQRPDAPAATAERVAMLQERVFGELFSAAQTAPDEESIRLLREALTLNSGSLDARVMLADRLIARHSVEEARQSLEPIINSPDADKPQVQEALAEIEVGRGQYQQAIIRYDRLARREPAKYSRRLDEIKQQWSAANMPPQYQRAIETDVIDRADFAVLTYWKVTSVRFAQNLGAPLIAIDIEGIPGREEIIRAIAIGLYDVDAVTRRVSPLRAINAVTLERLGARLLSIRGADCARAVPSERDESARAQKILAACGISDPSATVPPDSPVNGRTAAAMLDGVERVLPH
ncbi:MAG: hypothetical protein NVSMB68_02380 [Thermoanaerobaculia bacterium]